MYSADKIICQKSAVRDQQNKKNNQSNSREAVDRKGDSTKTGVPPAGRKTADQNENPEMTGIPSGFDGRNDEQKALPEEMSGLPPDFMSPPVPENMIETDATGNKGFPEEMSGPPPELGTVIDPRVLAREEAERSVREGAIPPLDELIENMDMYLDSSKYLSPRSGGHFWNMYDARLRVDLENNPNKRIDYGTDGSSFVEMLPDGTIHTSEKKENSENNSTQQFDDWHYTDGKSITRTQTHETTRQQADGESTASSYNDETVTFQQNPSMHHIASKSVTVNKSYKGAGDPDLKEDKLDPVDYINLKKTYDYGPWDLKD
jgi:hypothetical protein